MDANQKIAVHLDARLTRALDQLGPVPDRYRTASTHLGCCRVLDVNDLGYRTGAAQRGEDVVNIFHVGIFNTNRVAMST